MWPQCWQTEVIFNTVVCHLISMRKHYSYNQTDSHWTIQNAVDMDSSYATVACFVLQGLCTNIGAKPLQIHKSTIQVARSLHDRLRDTVKHKRLSTAWSGQRI